MFREFDLDFLVFLSIYYSANYYYVNQKKKFGILHNIQCCRLHIDKNNKINGTVQTEIAIIFGAMLK